MSFDLRHDGLFHTNGRLGAFFAQTEVEVVELKDGLCADLEIIELCSDITVLELCGNVETAP